MKRMRQRERPPSKRNKKKMPKRRRRKPKLLLPRRLREKLARPKSKQKERQEERVSNHQSNNNHLKEMLTAVRKKRLQLQNSVKTKENPKRWFIKRKIKMMRKGTSKSKMALKLMSTERKSQLNRLKPKKKNNLKVRTNSMSMMKKLTLRKSMRRK